jgi:hypothetical protein
MIAKTDKLFLILHEAGWSIRDTSFLSNEGVTWLVFGTKGDRSIHAEGKSREKAWKDACRQAEEMGLLRAR